MCVCVVVTEVSPLKHAVLEVVRSLELLVHVLTLYIFCKGKVQLWSTSLANRKSKLLQANKAGGLLKRCRIPTCNIQPLRTETLDTREIREYLYCQNTRLFAERKAAATIAPLLDTRRFFL